MNIEFLPQHNDPKKCLGKSLKWCVVFFTHIKLVLHVLACVCESACAGFYLTFQKWFVSFPKKHNRKTNLILCPLVWKKRKTLTLGHLKWPHPSIFTFWSYGLLKTDRFASCTRRLLKKKGLFKELCKKSLDNILD